MKFISKLLTTLSIPTVSFAPAAIISTGMHFDLKWSKGDTVAVIPLDSNIRINYSTSVNDNNWFHCQWWGGGVGPRESTNWRHNINLNSTVSLPLNLSLTNQFISEIKNKDYFDLPADSKIDFSSSAATNFKNKLYDSISNYASSKYTSTETPVQLTASDQSLYKRNTPDSDRTQEVINSYNNNLTSQSFAFTGVKYEISAPNVYEAAKMSGCGGKAVQIAAYGGYSHCKIFLGVDKTCLQVKVTEASNLTLNISVRIKENTNPFWLYSFYHDDGITTDGMQYSDGWYYTWLKMKPWNFCYGNRQGILTWASQNGTMHDQNNRHPGPWVKREQNYTRYDPSVSSSASCADSSGVVFSGTYKPKNPLIE